VSSVGPLRVVFPRGGGDVDDVSTNAAALVVITLLAVEELSYESMRFRPSTRAESNEARPFGGERSVLGCVVVSSSSSMCTCAWLGVCAARSFSHSLSIANERIYTSMTSPAPILTRSSETKSRPGASNLV
jgi:hypothetical protein